MSDLCVRAFATSQTKLQTPSARPRLLSLLARSLAAAQPTGYTFRHSPSVSSPPSVCNSAAITPSAHHSSESLSGNFMTANSEKCHQTLQVVLLGRIWRGICDLEFSDATSRSRDQGPGPDSGERGLVSGAGTDLGETQAAAVTTEGRGRYGAMQ